MKKKHLTIFFLVFFFSFKTLSAKITSNIVIKIEDQIITNYEIKNKILSSLVLSNQKINQENINKLKKQTLDFLIHQNLKKIELAKFNIEVSESEINTYLKSISSNNVLGLKKTFAENNLDYNLFLEEAKILIKWQKFIYQFYSNKIEIDESSVEREIQEIIKNNSNLEEFRLSEIEILLKSDETKEKIILDLRNQIKTNGFENTAVNTSIASTSINKGDLGWINGKSLSKNMKEIIDRLEVGEISKPIFRQNSVVIFKLTDKKNYQPLNINRDKLKQDLINQKKNELFNLYSRSHLSKLNNSSFIEYK